MAANVQSLAQHWKNFDLPSLQKELDVTATELANRQDESDTSRKRLVDLSRDFKRNTPEDVRKIVAPILKNFQAEVDNLSKRSKAAEAAFLTVYKKLIEVPDPVPSLEHCLSIQQRAMRTQDLEIENQQLRETLKDYNQEFKEVKNQEVTIKQLKEQLKQHEDKLENTLQVRAKEKEKELQRLLSERERQLNENQSILSQKVKEAEKKIAELQSALERSQSELFDLKSKYEEDSHAKSDEMEIIINDLERANQRAALAGKEASQLKEQLAAAKHSLQLADQIQKAPDMEQAVDIVTRSSLEVELAAKDKEISQLVDDIQRLQSSLNNLKETTSTKIAHLEEMVTEKDKIIEEMEGKLLRQNDYDEIKRELSILKSMEFGTSQTWGNSSPDDQGGNTISGEAKTTKPLEVLLLEKTKSLQSENTSLKISNADSAAQLKKLQMENDEYLSLLQEKNLFIEKLEDDLSRIKNLSYIYRGEGEGQADLSVLPSEIVAEATKDSKYQFSGNYPSDMNAAAETLLPIISSQRERFRQNNQRLETENLSLQQKLITAQNDIERLRADNVKLYEKIRFLQSYPSQQSKQYDEMDNRYSAEYEEKLNPFSTFSRKEKQRKYMNLSPFEKITLAMGKTILSNRTARVITLFYTLLLHCLIFLVLYKLAYTESCKRDLSSECKARFAEHMEKVHGETLM